MNRPYKVSGKTDYNRYQQTKRLTFCRGGSPCPPATKHRYKRAGVETRPYDNHYPTTDVEKQNSAGIKKEFIIMKKGIIRAVIALSLVFAMSIGMLASANYSDVGDSVILFYDQYNKGSETTYADISDVGGGWLKSYWTLYNGDNGNAQISYSDMSSKKVAGFGVHFGVRSDYFWYTVSSDRNLNYPTDKKVDTVKFGTMVSAANMKIYRYSNLIYNNGSYCMVRQASKLAMVGDTQNRTVKIYADGNYVTEVTKTFPNRDDDTTMVSSDVYVTALYGPYYTWSSKVENGYYRIDLSSRYTVTASVNANGSVSPTSRVINYNQSGTFAFSANTGYNIAYITDTGTKHDITDTASYTYTASNVTSARNIVATTVPINYTISYTLNGGSVSGNPTSYTIETTTFTLKNPTKTGYIFTGWTGSNGSTPQTSVSIAKGSTGNKSYTANWSPNTYYVAFNGNGATSGSMSDQTFSYGTAQALSSNAFSRAYTVSYNYMDGSGSPANATATATFGGWTGQDGKAYTNGQSVSNLTSTASAKFTMTANWTLGSVTLPTPTKTGYTFDGWYTADEGGTKIGNGGAAYTPSSNITLYAHWNPNIYKVTLDNQGATTAGTAQYWYMYEKMVTAADGEILYYYSDASCTTPIHNYTMVPPTKEGYVFGGYWTEKNGGGTQFILPSGECVNNIFQKRAADTTLYAMWTPISYIVRFNNVPGGTGEMADVTHLFNTEYILPSNAFSLSYTVTLVDGASTTEKKADAIFNGWEDRGSIIHKGVEYLYSTFDAPYYANKYNLGYNKYELISHYLSNTSNSTKGDTAGLYPNGASVRNLSTTAGGIVNLHANFSNGSITLPNPTKSGYEFAGWYSGATKIANGGDTYTPSTDITLTAVWTPETYAITYNLGGGSASGNPESYTVESDAITLNNPTREGYTFAGWTGTELSGASASVTIAKGSTGNRTYTATWTTESYTITYNLDGGSVSPANPTSYTVESNAITLNNPTKIGYEFLGWTGSNGSTPQLTVEIAKGSTGDKTYTANWKKTVFTVRWVDYDGTLLKTDTVNFDDVPEYNGAAPSRESTAEFDFLFDGWSPAIVAATEDATYTAKYKEKTREYQITFVNHDGSVLETKSAGYGTTPTYDGATPEKAMTESEVFIFSGWALEIVPVTGEATYTATFASAPREYTVTWVNHDGVVLETDSVAYNATPTYDGATPEKPKDSQYSYVFAGWTPEIVPVTADAEYTATFTQSELPPVAELKIVTSGCKAEQSFVFIVESAEAGSDFVPLEVSIAGNGQAIIKDIPTGKYTVTEEDPWTWRYAEEYKKSVTVEAAEENTVTFSDINIPTVAKWLSGLAALFK